MCKTPIPQLNEYIETVKNTSLAGELEQKAVVRFCTDLQRKDIVLDWQTVKQAIDFFKLLRHTKGKHAGESFTLEGWQLFILANIVGFKWKRTGTRRFIESYIEVARKNGKTAFAAGLSLYFLIADNEPGAEIDFAANSKEQAKIAFDMVTAFCKDLDPKKRDLKPLHNKIVFKAIDGKVNVFAADDSKLDGFNASFGLVDEYHAAKDSKVRDVIQSSQAMRENPHLCTITTAGFDKSSVCYALRTVAKSVLSGTLTDDTMFSMVFSLNEGDDWKSPENWRKANPNLGVTVKPEYLAAQITKAKNNPDTETGIRTKNFNEWRTVLEMWLPDQYISAAKIPKLRFENRTLFVGTDLAATSDLTAVSYLAIKNGKPQFRTDYYLPESALTEKADREKYRIWYLNGYLKLTPGNVTDYEYITADILAAQQNNHIQIITYDRYNATQWAIDATNAGLWLEEYSQTIGIFNRPTKEFERLVLKQAIEIETNPITEWCISNVRIRRDMHGNEKPDKGASAGKIDGVVSMIMALGGYLNNPQNEITIA